MKHTEIYIYIYHIHTYCIYIYTVYIQYVCIWLAMSHVKHFGCFHSGGLFHCNKGKRRCWWWYLLCPALRKCDIVKCPSPTQFLPLAFGPAVPLQPDDLADIKGIQMSVTSLFHTLKLLFSTFELSLLLSLSERWDGGLQWRILGEISSVTGGVSTAAEAESVRSKWGLVVTWAPDYSRAAGGICSVGAVSV